MDHSDTPSRHVLFLNWRDTTNPEGGGSEVYIERIAAELVTAGHRVTLLCAAHDQGDRPRPPTPGYGCCAAAPG